MDIILNDASGITSKSAFQAVKASVHPGLIGKLRKGIDKEAALQSESLSLRSSRSRDAVENLDFLEFFPNLKELTVNSNKLSNIDGLKYTPFLEELEITGSSWPGPLDLYPIRDCRALEYVWIELDGEYNSDRLYISGLESLARLPKLEGFTLWNLGIRDISFIRSMTFIEDADFDGNPIADFTPLQKHPSLTTLSLSNCGITDISFLAQMPNLYDISLEDNNIKDFSPLKEISSLKHISAGGNGLSADEIAKWNNEFRHIEEFHFYVD